MIKLCTGHVHGSRHSELVTMSRMHHSLTEIKHFGVMPLRFGGKLFKFLVELRSFVQSDGAVRVRVWSRGYCSQLS